MRVDRGVRVPAVGRGGGGVVAGVGGASCQIAEYRRQGRLSGVWEQASGEW